MDTLVYIILICEAAFGLTLLYFSGVLKAPKHVLIAAVLLAAAFFLRGRMLSYQTLDYQNFLSQWVDYFRENGGLKGLGGSIGNYNAPYLTFLALFSMSRTPDLYLIKLLSTFFDVVLSWAVMMLAGRFTQSAERRMLAFFLTLFWPTVVLNGALWGQCDSIYVAFSVLSIYLVLAKKPWLGVICIGAAFAFKLQAVFFIPVFLLFWITDRVKWYHFAAFPAINVALVLPAVFNGRDLWDALTIGLQETGSIGDGLNYNSPSIFAILSKITNTEQASTLAILVAGLAVVLIAIVFLQKRKTASDKALLLGAALMVTVIPFLLPHMHDRYFFGADMMSLATGCAVLPLMPVALLCEFASLLGYHAYLKMRYLLLMYWGAWALVIAMAVLSAALYMELNRKPKIDTKSKPKKKPAAKKPQAKKKPQKAK